MRLRLSQDARPQAMTLLIAATISVLLWFIPFAEFLTYPFRIFVTFIHEGGHALAALLTGNSVASLSVAMNASGETYTTQGGRHLANLYLECRLSRFDGLRRVIARTDSQGSCRTLRAARLFDLCFHTHDDLRFD